MLGIGFITLSVIIFMTVIFLFSKIQLSIAVTKAAAVYTKEVSTSFLVPVITFAFQLIIIALFSVAALYILSSGNI